ncbi:MAG: pyruvate dehydrogenase (acetyl-transferring) E1 component subunit alpha [Alphaproteobacteria bacterium]|nr:pyruvate dehydrogenase (acetyl-transferring) E1 component subunit alpha [Alphaproteobacteria bacterium]MCB9929688.1 pyruvate dehydrogenase (acetyl-transferring) E1 component subunit alpha [Alphaproteobacteria bacterium]
MRTTTFSGEISHFRYLNTDGTATPDLPALAADAAALIPLYEAMVLTRVVDERAVAMQRTGRLGTYASALGQEAVGVGTASAMRADDVLVPGFRDQAAQLWRGVSLVEHLCYWSGSERGSDYAGPRHDLPVSIPVGTNFPHAAGVALAFRRRGEDRVAVVMAGDGATSKGDFYEAMNIAGVWKLPVVFVINNNQWAISVPRAEQTAAETLAQKALAAGIPGEQVDGNDVVAVRDRVDVALARARRGDGPTLIEAITYRLGDHTTADDASRYREDDQVRRHWKEEPIARLRTYLAAQKVWDKQQEEALLADCRARIDAAVAAFEALPPEPPEAIFDHTYAALPADVAAQRAAVLAAGEN